MKTKARRIRILRQPQAVATWNLDAEKQWQRTLSDEADLFLAEVR